MTHSSEQLPTPLDKRRFKTERPKVLIRATAVGAVGLIAAVGFYIANKIDENNRSVKAAQARHDKILSDAHNAAVATVEKQRLNPASIKFIGGMITIAEGQVLASSPNYLNIPSAPGNFTVPKDKTIVVVNPIKVGNTYQFRDSCTKLLTNKFMTSNETASQTRWVSANEATSPQLMRAEPQIPVVTIDKNSAQVFNVGNNPVSCANLIDPNFLNLLDQVAGTDIVNQLTKK